MRSHLLMTKMAPIIMAALCLVLAPAANACPTQSAAARLNALRMSAMLRPVPARPFGRPLPRRGAPGPDRLLIQKPAQVVG